MSKVNGDIQISFKISFVLIMFEERDNSASVEGFDANDKGIFEAKMDIDHI